MSAIQQIIDAWVNGSLTLAEKRERIAEQNEFFHGSQRRSPVTREPLTEVRPVPMVPVPAQGEMFSDDEPDAWWLAS